MSTVKFCVGKLSWESGTIFLEFAMSLKFLYSEKASEIVEISILFLTFLSNFKQNVVGLDRTGHMSFLTGLNRTPEFAGQVPPD